MLFLLKTNESGTFVWESPTEKQRHALLKGTGITKSMLPIFEAAFEQLCAAFGNRFLVFTRQWFTLLDEEFNIGKADCKSWIEHGLPGTDLVTYFTERLQQYPTDTIVIRHVERVKRGDTFDVQYRQFTEAELKRTGLDKRLTPLSQPPVTPRIYDLLTEPVAAKYRREISVQTNQEQLVALLQAATSPGEKAIVFHEFLDKQNQFMLHTVLTQPVAEQVVEAIRILERIHEDAAPHKFIHDVNKITKDELDAYMQSNKLLPETVFFVRALWEKEEYYRVGKAYAYPS